MTDFDDSEEIISEDIPDGIMDLLWNTSPNCPLCGALIVTTRQFDYVYMEPINRKDWHVIVTQTCPHCGVIGACGRLAQPGDFSE